MDSVRAFQTSVLTATGHPQACWQQGGVTISSVAVGLTDVMAMHQAGISEITPRWLEEQIGEVVLAATQIACAAGIPLERALDGALAGALRRAAEVEATAATERASAAAGHHG